MSGQSMHHLILALTEPEPTRSQSVDILSEALAFAHDKLTANEDAEPQTHRIICALLHRDVNREDVRRALHAMTAIQKIVMGVDVDDYTDEPDGPATRDRLIDGFEQDLHAAIYDITSSIPKNARHT